MNKEKWSSLFWLVTGLLICIGSVRLSLGGVHNPGPGFFPFICGAILAILALIVYLQSRLAPSAAKEATPIWVDRKKGFKVVLAVLVLLAYAVGMGYLGYLVSTTLFIGCLLRIIEPKRWSMVILGSVLTAVISYCIFELWLQTQLPKGPFSIF